MDVLDVLFDIYLIEQRKQDSSVACYSLDEALCPNRDRFGRHSVRVERQN